MMNNLVLHVQGLDYCRFYAENMIHVQFENPLRPVPPEAPYNQPINDRKLHMLINDIDMAFEHAVNRTDLEFPIGPILYRYRSLYGNYAAQYNDERIYSGSPSSIGKPNTRNRPIQVPNVPEQGSDEDDKAFSYRFIKHTAEQVQSYIWMVCLDQYAREQTDEVLPSPPWAFDPPERDGAAAFLTAHHKILNDLMPSMMNTHSDTLDIHVSLRDYGMSVIFPLVAECRNVIYAAWTIPNAKGQKPQFAPTGEHTTFEDLPLDDDTEEFEPIPPIGPMFENQEKWEDIVASVAAGLGLIAFTDDSDSGFELIPRIYANADDFMYHNVGNLSEKFVFDIALTPADVHPDRFPDKALHDAVERIQKHALEFNCHTITRLVGYSGELKTVLIRVQRNADLPDQDFVIENLPGALNV